VLTTAATARRIVNMSALAACEAQIRAQIAKERAAEGRG